MKLTILGAGCWGATLAWLLTDNFEEICLWSRKDRKLCDGECQDLYGEQERKCEGGAS